MAKQLKKKVGAPCKLTLELQTKICELIEAGNFFNTAALLCHISKDTFQLWMRKGLQEESGIYHDFRVAVEEADAKSEADLLSNIKQYTATDWKSTEFIMKKRHKKNWGDQDKTKVEISGPDGGPIATADYSKLTTTELEQILGLLDKAKIDE